MFARQDYIFRISRKGGTVRFCREKYLREDIPCGLSFCPEHIDYEDSQHTQPTLLKNDDNFNGILGIIDHRVILEQIAFLESPYVVDLVVPQTVVDYLKLKNPSLYRRLSVCLETPSKQFFQFFNEFHVGISLDKSSYEDESEYISQGFILLLFF